MVSKQKTHSKNDLNTLSRGGNNMLQTVLEQSFNESDLDPKTFMMVRMAALAAMDASPASWFLNLKVGEEMGISEEDAMGVLIAITPVIGTARVMSAAGAITKAMVMSDEMKEDKSTKKTHVQAYH
jgi:4-carboxymuconolactone decarboxylase